MSKNIFEFIKLLENYSYDCKDSDICADCSFSYFCESGWSPNQIIEELKKLLILLPGAEKVSE